MEGIDAYAPVAQRDAPLADIGRAAGPIQR